MRMQRYLLLSVVLPALLSAGSVTAENAAMLELASSRGCFICHTIVPDKSKEGPVLGPSYQEVAARYRGDEGAFDRLLDRVLHGSAYREQAWAGKVAMRFMPPNVNVSRPEASALVKWILELDVQPEVVERLVHHDKMMALSTYSGCMICHHLDPMRASRAVPLAPSFREIAAEYADRSHAQDRLVQAVLEGTMGSGSKIWNNVNMHFMPPSVNVKQEDANQLVAWILSLDTTGIERRRTPPRPNRSKSN